MKSKKIGNERRRNRNRKQNGEQVTSNRSEIKVERE